MKQNNIMVVWNEQAVRKLHVTWKGSGVRSTADSPVVHVILRRKLKCKVLLQRKQFPDFYSKSLPELGIYPLLQHLYSFLYSFILRRNFCFPSYDAAMLYNLKENVFFVL